MASTSSPVQGRVHLFNKDKHLTCFEFGSEDSYNLKDYVLFIGGLGDTFLSVPYLPALHQALKDKGWGLVQVGLSSSGAGWGKVDVGQDADEIVECVRYLREHQGKARAVLLGHSTGCQDCVNLFRRFPSGHLAPLNVSGIILQAPVSDREFLSGHYNGTTLSSLISQARHLVDEGKGDWPVQSSDLSSPVSAFGGVHISASRWLSIASKGGYEDFFSSDLTDQELAGFFRRINVKVLMLLGSEDSAYPKSLDIGALLGRFQNACSPDSRTELSRVLVGASHPIVEEGPQKEFLGTVVSFVTSL